MTRSLNAIECLLFFLSWSIMLDSARDAINEYTYCCQGIGAVARLIGRVWANVTAAVSPLLVSTGASEEMPFVVTGANDGLIDITEAKIVEESDDGDKSVHYEIVRTPSKSHFGASFRESLNQGPAREKRDASAGNVRILDEGLQKKMQVDAAVHSIKEGMRLEAKDRKNPSLICVATIKQVRLFRWQNIDHHPFAA